MSPSMSSSPRTSQLDDLVSAVLTASRVLVGVAATSLAEIEGTVTLAQFRTLVVLDTRGESPVPGIAASLGVTSSTVTRLVERLLAAGLVTRYENPLNRRESIVGLSQAGAELVWRVTDKRRAEIARIVRQMPAARRDDLVAALSAFAEAAGEPPARGPATFGW
jgi:DNA-binding MarR family transcriptional regulator